ncbi:hypothetical protein JZ751_010440 [Albula glossodonta]|uniref:Uncharacterized protein n=1 Tax=Albula glossodonta TaxID=121402 RepID=A0A8T2NUX0_9TELE|nr:hypothetical protein JZ751_010440 [Albula glossodonta]
MDRSSATLATKVPNRGPGFGYLSGGGCLFCDQTAASLPEETSMEKGTAPPPPPRSSPTLTKNDLSPPSHEH